MAFLHSGTKAQRPVDRGAGGSYTSGTMTRATHSLAELNAATGADFAAALGDVFEHAPWVAAAAAAARPFPTVSALHDGLMQAVRAAPRASRLGFLRGHPELGGKVARAGAMTDASKAEQGGLGLDRLGAEEFARFERLNDAYRDRFGFPFIICVRQHTRDSILAQFEQRLGNDADAELAAALAEIAHITRLRLAAQVDGPGMPKTSGELTVHIIDMLSGRAASGVAVALYEMGASATGLLVAATTNANGGTDPPLLAGAPLRIGTYELRIEAAAYFAARGAALPTPPFLDVVPIRFSVAEPEGDYHVPVRMTPWSYTAYRGS
jgi:2-oxo-4-hydroxy-4-carboxy-5-ureidoimidazoline decarboxylase